jgi:hypothetical protein
MQDLIFTAVNAFPSHLPTIDNPLDGLIPDFSFGGAKFTQLWQKLITAVWGIAILASIVYLALGTSRWPAHPEQPTPTRNNTPKVAKRPCGPVSPWPVLPLSPSSSARS